jgi:hypothetical protein
VIVDIFGANDPADARTSHGAVFDMDPTTSVRSATSSAGEICPPFPDLRVVDHQRSATNHAHGTPGAIPSSGVAAQTTPW